MAHAKLEPHRTDIRLIPDSSRVLIRPFIPMREQRIIKIIGRVMSLTEKDVQKELDKVMADFARRHVDIHSIFIRHFEIVRKHMMTDLEPSQPRKLLIGSYFTSEYALESAALFNPSIVPHPDQSGLAKNSLRFVMSLRAIGEGHLSSISFRQGIIDAHCTISIDETTRFVTPPDPLPNAAYDKVCYSQKLFEMGMITPFSQVVLDSLNDSFTLTELTASLTYHERYNRHNGAANITRTKEGMLWLAKSNYEVLFPEDLPLSQRIIFPDSPSERNGIEDARFVLFEDDNGEKSYYATYTAYDGESMLPQLIETTDFRHFTIITLNGEGVQNKGMALFPRKLNGKYVMLSRQDNENIFLMYSDNIHFWHETRMLMKPSYTWEFVQLGNCGSPLETDEGWVVLTHGVGPMRRYCIGAMLLDLEDPSKIIGRLKEPLLKPEGNEREGYVPNVVYTCGALIHKGNLVIPYAMADYATSIAIVGLEELLAYMK
jgi:predicted GH43/DUF377 family glycosyl hydrolase